MTLAERFRQKYEVDAVSGCWNWTASRDARGYGRIAMQSPTGYRPVVASRVAYFLSSGQWPLGMEVCHSCDNPACVNPQHLWLGTHKDNMDDRDAKGRCNGRPDLRSMTKCKHGHELSGDNLQICTGGFRRCKTCGRDRTRRYRSKKELK